MITIFNIFQQLISLPIRKNIFSPHAQTFFPKEFFSKTPISGIGEYTFMIITVGLFILMVIFFVYNVFKTYLIRQKTVDRFTTRVKGELKVKGYNRGKAKFIIDDNDDENNDENENEITDDTKNTKWRKIDN